MARSTPPPQTEESPHGGHDPFQAQVDSEAAPSPAAWQNPGSPQGAGASASGYFQFILEPQTED